MKDDLGNGSTGSEADLDLAVIHNLESDPFGRRRAPPRVNLRRCEMHLEAESSASALALYPPAQVEGQPEGLGSLPQDELAWFENQFGERLRSHPFIGVRVQAHHDVDVFYLRKGRSPEDVVEREVDRDAQVVEVDDRRADEQADSA